MWGEEVENLSVVPLCSSLCGLRYSVGWEGRYVFYLFVFLRCVLVLLCVDKCVW